MKKTIRQLTKEAVEEIKDQRLIAQEKWLFDTFGFTVDDFEREELAIKLGVVPHNAGLKIKDTHGVWSSSIMSWEELHAFFENAESD